MITREFIIKGRPNKGKMEIKGMKGSDIKSKHLYICFPQADKSPPLMLDWCIIIQTSIKYMRPESPVY